MHGASAILAALVCLAGCAAAKEPDYATTDYRSWQRTTDVVLDYPISGHQDRLRIPRMNAIGFTAKPTMENGKQRWDFPVGTVIVKEVYATPTPAPFKKPIQHTTMAKEPRYPHPQGG